VAAATPTPARPRPPRGGDAGALSNLLRAGHVGRWHLGLPDRHGHNDDRHRRRRALPRGTVNCIDTSNDPRASGTFTASWNVEWWGTDGNTGANVQWGTAKLVNAGGAWEGRGTGVYSTDRGGTIVIWFKGTGGYAGLTYFWEGTGPASPWIIHGLIHPGEPPTP